MLVNLYKTKTPIAVFSLPLLIAILVLPVLFNPTLILPTIYSWQYDLMDNVVKTPWINYLLSFSVVYLSAIELNRVVNNYGFYSKNTYLPGLIYAIILCAFEQCHFQMATVAYGFLIYGLGYLFQINRQEPAKSAVFMASLLFGIATIFEPLLIVVLLLPWLSLAVFRSFIWREWVILLIGFSIPWVYHYALNFIITGKTDIPTEGLALVNHALNFSLGNILLIVYSGILIVFSIWKFLVIMTNQLLVFKKRSRLLFHFIWLMLISYGLSWFLYDHSILGVIIPIAIIISVQMLYSKGTLFSNLSLLIWILLILLNQFFLG